MKYIRGDQDYTLSDAEMTRVILTGGEIGEGIWAKQGDDHVVLQNSALAFYPFPSWGAILPSKGGNGDECEEINIASMRAGPMELTLHPDAWDLMFEQGVFDENGMFIPPPEEDTEEQPEVE